MNSNTYMPYKSQFISYYFSYITIYLIQSIDQFHLTVENQEVKTEKQIKNGNRGRIWEKSRHTLRFISIKGVAGVGQRLSHSMRG